MAISKIMHMKDCGKAYHGMHLKRAIEYITAPEKTQDGWLVGAVNCFVDRAYEQMRSTKQLFEKNNQRQGYHIVISFQEGEVTPETALEITQRFTEEYVGSRYEAVFAVHDNTDHIHGHIVFNSVSFVDGKKYHYKKGDWERDIQPITNRLCQKYGLSVLEIDGERANTKEREWSVQKDGQFVWGDMIKRDLDACIIQAPSFESFLDLLKDKGYEIKTGKYLAVKPPGMNRYKRCKSLGEDYSEDRIRERVSTENLQEYVGEKAKDAGIIRCRIKRYRKAAMSGLQKKYYARLYRLGKLKRRAYSQAWKYKDDIKRMQKLQAQYLFLARHNIQSLPELAAVIDNLMEKKKAVTAEKRKVYKADSGCKSLFQIADEMKELEDAQTAYQNGDNFFAAEYQQWITLEQKLAEEGYTYEEVLNLKSHYKQQLREVNIKESAVRKELAVGISVWQDATKDTEAKAAEEIGTMNRKDREKQPVR